MNPALLACQSFFLIAFLTVMWVLTLSASIIHPPPSSAQRMRFTEILLIGFSLLLIAAWGWTFYQFTHAPQTPIQL